MEKPNKPENKTLPQDLKLNDVLAIRRTKLANERTFLSYMRSAIYLATAGIAFFKMNDYVNMDYIGEICIVSSGVILVLGFIRYFRLERQIKDLYTDKEKNKRTNALLK